MNGVKLVEARIESTNPQMRMSLKFWRANPEVSFLIAEKYSQKESNLVIAYLANFMLLSIYSCSSF